MRRIWRQALTRVWHSAMHKLAPLPLEEMRKKTFPCVTDAGWVHQLAMRCADRSLSVNLSVGLEQLRGGRVGVVQPRSSSSLEVAWYDLCWASVRKTSVIIA